MTLLLYLDRDGDMYRYIDRCDEASIDRSIDAIASTLQINPK
jgi:hypothetical protein